jgi:hypothetical protein
VRCMTWTAVLGIALLLAGVSGCGGHDLWWRLPSESGGSGLQVSNDAGYIGSQTGDYRTHH